MSGIEESLELTELAEEMLRERLLRHVPCLTEAEIEERIDQWYGQRPGAEFGDAEGTPGPWPRR